MKILLGVTPVTGAIGLRNAVTPVFDVGLIVEALHPQHRRSRSPRQASSFMETPSSSQGYPPSVAANPESPEQSPGTGFPHPPAIWESILGPQSAGAQEPEETLFTLDAFHKQPSTPSFKPDYSHLSYNLGQVDPAKCNLFQTPAHGGSRELHTSIECRDTHQQHAGSRGHPVRTR